MESDQTEQHTRKKMSTPAAIIIAGVFIAVAIFGAVMLQTRKNDSLTTPDTSEASPSPVTVDDHFRGNPNAEIAIIEYSDTDCPFCKEFHTTLKDVVASDEDVLWVYRHLPLDSLHPRASEEAHASECVADLLGEEAFWSYLDVLFAVESSKNADDTTTLTDEAVRLGANREKFESCMTSVEIATMISEQMSEGRAIGGKGTPFTVIMNRKGSKVPILGAESADNIRAIISSLRK